MPKVFLSVSNNVETDYRVNKVASLLHDNGYDVHIIGAKSRECHDFVKPYRITLLNLFFKKSFLFYAEFNIRLFFKLLFSEFDILIANDTDTVLPNYFVSKIRKKELVVDLHELFPEVPELVNRKFVKSVWIKIEDFVFPKIKNGYTVCDSIANYYNKRYNINLKVVRNIPYKREYQGKGFKFNSLGKKVILYQGAVNIGRGIEWIIDAMPFVDDAMFVIIGDGDILSEIKDLVSKRNLSDRVLFLGKVSIDNLLEYTCSADLGVCLLQKMGLSYYYSLPNRIFDFMQCHVPILATDFPEIKNIVDKYKTGKTISCYEPQYLAKVINEMLNSKIDNSIYNDACAELNWENESQIILSILKSIK